MPSAVRPRPLRLGLAAATAAALAASALASCDTNDGRELAPARAEQNESMLTEPPPPTGADTTAEVDTAAAEEFDSGDFEVTVPWGGDDGQIDAKYTCRGANVSPAISWGNVPDGTVEIAIVFSEPDADSFVHWVVWGLPVDGDLVDDDPMDGFKVGTNGFERSGYSGPCPSDGATHIYSVDVYALTEPITLGADAPTREVLNSIFAVSQANATVTGRFP